MDDVRIFNSKKEYNRLEFIKRIAYTIGAVLIIHFLRSIRYSERNTSETLKWVVDIGIGCMFLIWTLTTKIITQLQLDVTNQKFIIFYLTVFSSDEKIEVPLESLSLKFEKNFARYQHDRWTLTFFNNTKKVLSIDTSKNGFTKESLEDLVKQIESIKR